MRFFGKNWIKNGLALAFVSVCVGVLALFFACPFCAVEGEKGYFLYSESSQAVIKESFSLKEAFFLTGQSVRVELEFKTDKEREDWVKGELERWKAVLLFKENADGVVCYYAYCSRLGRGILLNGEFVNLHIAVRGNVATVGSPIVFGGY